MKDYSFSRDNDFIINYYVCQDSILVNYAGGKTEEFPKDKKTEVKLLMKMREQILDMGHEYEIKDCLKFSIINLVLSGLIGVGVFSFLLINHIFFTMAVIPYIFSYLNVYYALCQIWNIIECNVLLKDLAKNKLFLKNELNLRRTYRLGYDNHPINLNDVHNISKGELNNLVKKSYKKRILKK